MSVNGRQVRRQLRVLHGNASRRFESYRTGHPDEWPFAVGIAVSCVLHLLLLLAMIFGVGGATLPTGIVYSISLEGGSSLGGREQSPSKDKSSVVRPPKNVAENKPQPEKVTPVDQKAEVSTNEKKSVKPTPPPQPTASIKKKAEATKAPVEKKKEPTKADVEKDYQKALQRYLGESAEAGGKGFGAAKLGGKGMGGGVQMPPEFFTYKQMLRSRIREGWKWFDVRAPLVTRISFSIDPRGTISEVAVVTSSGNREFDDSVLRAVYKANPLPPPPQTVYESFKSVVMNFDPRED